MTEFVFTVHPFHPGSEILIAELFLPGCEGFWEEEEIVRAYGQDGFETEITPRIALLEDLGISVKYEKRPVPDINWNREWEKSFRPVIIKGCCAIRATFHARPEGVIYDVVIDPEMAFGTGHHETTRLMIEQMLSMDFSGKRVLDIGCGTGILAVLASLAGASSVLALDTQSEAVRSAEKNAGRNKVNNMITQEGSVEQLSGLTFDMILANINRNILAGHLPHYYRSLNEKGRLLISGFYDQDSNLLTNKAEQLGFRCNKKNILNQWALLDLLKEA